MSERITPALTPEEWEYAMHEDVRDGLAYEVTYLWGRSRQAGAIALANAALPDDDPRKITRERVNILRELWAECPYEYQTALRELADALESYLPPA